MLYFLLSWLGLYHNSIGISFLLSCDRKPWSTTLWCLMPFTHLSGQDSCKKHKSLEQLWSLGQKCSSIKHLYRLKIFPVYLVSSIRKILTILVIFSVKSFSILNHTFNHYLIIFFSFLVPQMQHQSNWSGMCWQEIHKQKLCLKSHVFVQVAIHLCCCTNKFPFHPVWNVMWTWFFEFTLSLL